MLTFLLLTLSPLTVSAIAAEESGTAKKKVLFTKEKWYQNQKGKEQTFSGTLKANKQVGIGFGRYVPYRLEMKKGQRGIYVGSKRKILAPYVGKKVKIVGKAVDRRLEGQTYREIWPASVEIIQEEKGGEEGEEEKEGKGEVKIQARAYWRASSRPGTKAIRQAVRSAAELKKVTGSGTEEAAMQRAKRMLKVNSIDFDKQTLIIVSAGAKPTGGYRVEVKKVIADGKTLTVKWKLHSPRGLVTQAFTHPAEGILVPKFEGKVKFEQVK